MDERPAQENTELMKRRKMFKETRTTFSVLCLLLAFPCGWLLAFLLAQLGRLSLVIDVAGFVTVFSPIWLGIIAALPVGRRNTHLTFLFLTLGIAFLAWIGWGVCWLAVATQQDAVTNAQCVQMQEQGLGYCHVGGLAVGFTQMGLLFGAVPLLLCSTITFFVRTSKERRSARAGFR